MAKLVYIHGRCTERFDDGFKRLVIGKRDEKTFRRGDEGGEGKDLELDELGEIPRVVCLLDEASSCVLSMHREYVQFQKTVQ